MIVVIATALNSCSPSDTSPAESVISAPDYQRGVALMGTNNDSAFYYFNKVATSSKDSLEIATSYNNMAVIQADASDYFGSQETLLTSLKYLDESKERNYYCLASNYNELGTSSLHLKNYAAAIRYYDKSLSFSKDDNLKKVVLNNKAFCYQQTGEYDKSRQLYNLIMAESSADQKAYARALTNMAMTKWLQDSSYNAAPELLTSLAIRRNEKDSWGLNSSYLHLAEFYTKSRPDSALYYAEQLQIIARWLNSPDDEMEALQMRIRLGADNDVKPLFIRYQHLSDSVQQARNSAKNQFALIRYDAEKNLADNLKLQRDNSENKLQIVRQKILLYSVLLFLFAAAVVSVQWYRKRRDKMLREKENAIRENQLATSQKVHDVVANGLYRLMAEIEHKPSIDKEVLLDNMENLYERSRDISYEQTMTKNQSFDQIVSALLTSFASPTTAVLIRGNNPETWEGLSEFAKQQLSHVFQELMVNMSKHSQAANTTLKFERIPNKVKIDYADDGIGMPANMKFGNGLKNTENRINSIGGELTFDRQASKGWQLTIYVPISNHG